MDGTESSIAAEALNVSNAIALRESLLRVLGDRQLPIEARPRVLFNPDTRSANFFIPGLMVVMCQMMSTMLSANAIVREKELGTLEQLYMTPVKRGELIVGIPLVAEAFADTFRARVLGVMMTGGAFGSLIGGWIYGLIGAYGWRYVFFAGIAPAVLLFFIRRGMVEPEHFQAVKARRQAAKTNAAASAEDREFLRFVPVQLFTRRNRYSTMVGLMFCLGTLLAIWTTVIWLPTIQTQMLERDGITGPAAIPFVSRGMMLWGIGGIFGYALFGFIADLIGRRATIILYNLGTLALGFILYLGVSDYTYYPYLLPIYGFFVLGVFSGRAVYLPELFPTHVRATAVSFCNGTGRIVTSTGPLIAGLLVGYFGGFTQGAAIMTCFALLSIVAMFLGRETKEAPLPLFEVAAEAKQGR